MPLIFNRSLIKSAGASEPEVDNRTIVTMTGRSVSNSNIVIKPASFTIVQDPGGLISGSAIGDANARYLPLYNGTYTFQITGFSSSSFSVSSNWKIGVGYYNAPNGFSVWGDGFTYYPGTTLTAPSSTKSITITGSNGYRGLFYEGSSSPGSVPSVTIAFE
jgi:hypothetical protein